MERFGGLAASVLVCCLTCSSVAAKVAHHRATAAPPPSSPPCEPLAGVARTRGGGPGECPICWEPFAAAGGDLAVPACAHPYHFSCLEAYALKRARARDTPLLCPLCQRAVAVSGAPFGAGRGE